MKILHIILFATFLFITNLHALTTKEIETKVDALLEKNEPTEFANKLAKKKSNSTEELLIKLSVFSRAGHRQRFLSTLQEIGKIYSKSNQKPTIYSSVRNHLDRNDLAQLQIYYNKIAVNGNVKSRNVLNFIKLWQKETNDQEIENWLKAQADRSDSWWSQWLFFKKSIGTATEVYEELEQKLRNHPTNFDLLDKYISNVPREYKDRVWLLDVVPHDSAYKSYTIARYFSPYIAIKLYEKSLKMPFVDEDKVLASKREFRFGSMGRRPPNFFEKYFRYQAKLRLIKLYRQTKQTDLAQPLVEELAKQDNSSYVARLAGWVQLVTGQRKVEKQILESETENQHSLGYWLKRAAYYEGRNEKKIVWQTYLKGLSKFPYDPKDRKKFYSRLEILKDLARFGEKFDELATERILSKEIAKAKVANDGFYLLELADITEGLFDNVYRMNFINTDLYVKALSTVKEWNTWEYTIEFALQDVENWDENKRNEVIDRLSSISLGDLKNRGFYLAKALQDEHPGKAVLLFEELAKIAPREINGEFNFDRDDIEKYLFEAYLKSGNWKKAEVIFNKNNYRKSKLSRIAVYAANNGDIDDAVRLWRMNANYDRRVLGGLSALAKTNAKPLLQRFYIVMKNRDPLTNIPDKALSILSKLS